MACRHNVPDNYRCVVCENGKSDTAASESALNDLLCGDYFLPKIDESIFEAFRDTDLIELVDDKPDWTQVAVDFAVVLNNAKAT